MTRWMGWLVLVALMAAGSVVLDWWTVPALAVLYGAMPFARPTWVGAALASAGAWGALLLAAAVQGPVVELAAKVGDMFSLPGWGFVALTLVFPAALAGAACELAISLRRLVDRRREIRALASP